MLRGKIYIISIIMYIMPAPRKEENKKTTICITKHNKQNLRRYAVASNNRKGYESDDEILTRLFIELRRGGFKINDIPKDTYDI